jgi:hypothetical protein
VKVVGKGIHDEVPKREVMVTQFFLPAMVTKHILFVQDGGTIQAIFL